MEAVVYDLYHNEHQMGVKDILLLLHKQLTTGEPQMMHLLAEVNSREFKLIRENAAKAWQRARFYALVHRAINGPAAQLNLIKWWRTMAYNRAWMAPFGWRHLDFAYTMQLVDTGDTGVAGLPDGYDMDDWEALGEDALRPDDPKRDSRWWLLPEETRDAFKLKEIQRYVAGVRGRAAEAEAQARREKCAAAAEKRAAEAAETNFNLAVQNASLAFRKPDVVDAEMREVYRNENPDFEKEKRENERKKEQRAKEKAAKRKAEGESSNALLAPSKKKKQKKKAAADSSDDEPPARSKRKAAAVSDSSDSESDAPAPKRLMGRHRTLSTKKSADSSDESDSDDNGW